MAENLLNRKHAASAEKHAHRPWAWYPNVNKHSDSAFVYLNSLAEDQPGVYKKANNLMS